MPIPVAPASVLTAWRHRASRPRPAGPPARGARRNALLAAIVGGALSLAVGTVSADPDLAATSEPRQVFGWL
jgi:hypothetical protein